MARNKKNIDDENPEDEFTQDEEGGVALATAVGPFEVEADHPRNCDLLIQCIPGLRLRSKLDGKRPVKDAKSGEWGIPEDQVRAIGALEVPGMRLAVNPEKCSYIVRDELRDNDQALERLEKHLKKRNMKPAAKINGVETQKGNLDKHRMKTLVRELYYLVTSGEAKVTRGELPSMEAIEEMEGDFLLNPGARTHWNQPRFEKNWDKWLSELTKVEDN